MFITREQLDKRLESPKNLVNIVEKGYNQKEKPLSPGSMSVPIIDTSHPHPAIKEQLPNESAKQKAARIARSSVPYGKDKGSYTPNPNIKNDIFRATIGSLSEIATSQQIQKEFGVTKNQIIGAKESKKKSISERIEKNKDRVSELALDRLMDTLGLLTSEKMENEKPRDLANIAASMAKVVSSMTKESKSGSENKISLTVVTPSIRDISSYTVVDV